MQTTHPPCHCPEPTHWDERRYDGVWDLSDENARCLLESRTCLECGATKSVEVAT